MSKQQTRRSISVKGTTYARLDNAKASGIIVGSISDYIEQLIDSDMRARGVPVVDKAPTRPKAKAEPDDPVASGAFSF